MYLVLENVDSRKQFSLVSSDNLASFSGKLLIKCEDDTTKVELTNELAYFHLSLNPDEMLHEININPALHFYPESALQSQDSMTIILSVPSTSKGPLAQSHDSQLLQTNKAVTCPQEVIVSSCSLSF